MHKLWRVVAQRRVVARQRETFCMAQPSHRGVGAEPGAERRKHHVEGILGVADYRERREHVPDRAPIRGPDTAPAGHGGGEEHIGGVGRGRGGDDAQGDHWVDGEDHVEDHVRVSAMDLQ